MSYVPKAITAKKAQQIMIALKVGLHYLAIQKVVSTVALARVSTKLLVLQETTMDQFAVSKITHPTQTW